VATAPRRDRQHLAVRRDDVRSRRRARDLPGHQRFRQVPDPGAAAAAVLGRRPAAAGFQGVRHGQHPAADARRVPGRTQPHRLRLDRAAPRNPRGRRGIPHLRARREGVEDLAVDQRLVAVHHQPPGRHQPAPGGCGPGSAGRRPAAGAAGRGLRARRPVVPSEGRGHGLRRSGRPVRRPAAPAAHAAQPRRGSEGAGRAAGADPVRRAAAAGRGSDRAAGDLVRRPGVDPGEHRPAHRRGQGADGVPVDLLRLRVRRAARPRGGHAHRAAEAGVAAQGAREPGQAVHRQARGPGDRAAHHRRAGAARERAGVEHRRAALPPGLLGAAEPARPREARRELARRSGFRARHGDPAPGAGDAVGGVGPGRAAQARR
jgi:hypothetical protein